VRGKTAHTVRREGRFTPAPTPYSRLSLRTKSRLSYKLIIEKPLAWSFAQTGGRQAEACTPNILSSGVV